jgi:hypothetical protein
VIATSDPHLVSWLTYAVLIVQLGDATRFCQPFGVTALPGKLVVSECESSTVRVVDFIRQEAPVATLFGRDDVFPDNLSNFGDRDGRANQARVQAPAGMATINREWRSEVGGWGLG